MAVYYNEIDLYAAEWLRNLIKAGHIADGEVDTRSIVDVQPDDLQSFSQCHFFAGIAGWSHALRLAGWSDDRQIWTGSCPCQPFSVAGQGKGTDDPRHLWPHFFRLIRGCRPPVIMGEQVAGAAGYGWLDGVRSDLESEDYSCQGIDIPACSVNAPHIRQRLYWCAVVNSYSSGQREHGRAFPISEEQPSTQCSSGDAHDLVDTQSIRRGERWPEHEFWFGRTAAPSASGINMADANGKRRGAWSCGDMVNISSQHSQHSFGERIATWRGNYSSSGSSTNANFWDNASWLNGADGKTRRAKPGVRLLAHGVPARVGKLRAYGNAIVPQVAAEVIRAFMSVYP